MAYTKTVWKDYPDTTTKMTAQKLNNIENGIEDLEDGIEALDIGKVNKTDKATGAEVVTGTDDTKYMTAKALKDTQTNLGAWTAYTPTTTNLTKGSGTLTASYCRIGKTIHFKIKFILGVGSAIGTTPYFSLPVTAKTADIKYCVILFDANAGKYNGTLDQSTTNAVPYTFGAGGLFTGITATAPFTWTTTDYIQIMGTYETE